MPILITNYPVHGFEIFNLEQYEITLEEPVHDNEGHITNLSDGLMEHLNKNDKPFLLETTGIYTQQEEILHNICKNCMYCQSY